MVKTRPNFKLSQDLRLTSERLRRVGRNLLRRSNKPAISKQEEEVPRITRVEVRHANPAISDQVQAWYSGTLSERILDGDRSVHIPHPTRQGLSLKIKGAGFLGKPIQFGTFHRTGPKAPVFDFEGRMMEDVAAGHDNAFQGGAAFQQAATEYRTTEMLERLGYSVVPCPGYGRVEDQYGRSSWFSIFEWDPAWNSRAYAPHIPLDEWIEANLEIGKLIVELAQKHDLIGYCWYVAEPGGNYRLKDLHPFRMADPVNMSQISWVMQVFFCLHIRCNTARHYTARSGFADAPEDLHILPLRTACPNATKADHEALRTELVAPYMLGAPAHFSPEKLFSILKDNPITRALLELCPERYTRF